MATQGHRGSVGPGAIVLMLFALARISAASSAHSSHQIVEPMG
jgi:hypothetical protein